MMFFWLVNLTILFLHQTTACHPAAWILAGHNLCFWVTSVALDTEDSDLLCKQDNGHLAVIPSQEVNTDLFALHGNAIGAADNTNGLWISVTDKVTEGHYTTWEGDELTFDFWRSGQPNDDSDPEVQDCVRIRQSDNFRWADKGCQNALKALCSASTLTTTTTPETTTTVPQTTTTTQQTTTSTPETTTTTPETTTTVPQTTTTVPQTTTTVPQTTTTVPQTTTTTPETTTTVPHTTTTTQQTTTTTPETTTTVTQTTTTVPQTTTTTQQTTTTTPETTTTVPQTTTTTSETTTTVQQTTTTTQQTTTTTPETTTTVPQTTTSTPETTSSSSPQTTSQNEESTDTTSPTTSENSGVCSCSGNNVAGNYTGHSDTQLETMRNALLIDVKETSAYKRTLTSASDPRPSAKAMGLTAVAMMVTPFALIIMPDVFNTIRSMFYCIKG